VFSCGRAISIRADRIKLLEKKCYRAAICKALLSGGANTVNIDQNFCPMVARVCVKKSSRDNCTLTHKTANGFPVQVLRNDELHFANAGFRDVNDLRITIRCANACHERKNYRRFLAIPSLD